MKLIPTCRICPIGDIFLDFGLNDRVTECSIGRFSPASRWRVLIMKNTVVASGIFIRHLARLLYIYIYVKDAVIWRLS